MSHRERAKELLEHALLAKTGSDVEVSRQAQALVEAVLELAEQQRVANLIALANSSHFSTLGIDRLVEFLPFEPFGSGPEFRLLDDIREALDNTE